MEIVITDPGRIFININRQAQIGSIDYLQADVIHLLWNNGEHRHAGPKSLFLCYTSLYFTINQISHKNI